MKYLGNNLGKTSEKSKQKSGWYIFGKKHKAHINDAAELEARILGLSNTQLGAINHRETLENDVLFFLRFRDFARKGLPILKTT